MPCGGKICDADDVISLMEHECRPLPTVLRHCTGAPCSKWDLLYREKALNLVDQSLDRSIERSTFMCLQLSSCFQALQQFSNSGHQIYTWLPETNIYCYPRCILKVVVEVVSAFAKVISKNIRSGLAYDISLVIEI